MTTKPSISTPQRSFQGRPLLLDVNIVAIYIVAIYIVANYAVGDWTLRKAGGNWVDGDRFFDREAEVEALSF